MGIETGTAILLGSLLAGGAAVHASEQSRKASNKQADSVRRAAAANKDKRVITPKGIAKRNARAALVVGSAKGVLSLEDGSATSGRGTLLGN